MDVKLSGFLGFIIDGILFPIQSLLTRLNSQRLPVTQYRLHSKVIFLLVNNYYTLSSDANNLNGLPVVKPRSQGLSSFLPIKRESLGMMTSLQHRGFDSQSNCD